jgi:hypothetical protein
MTNLHKGQSSTPTNINKIINISHKSKKRERRTLRFIEITNRGRAGQCCT